MQHKFYAVPASGKRIIAAHTALYTVLYITMKTFQGAKFETSFKLSSFWFYEIQVAVNLNYKI
jgi:hypothetical protein